ncbi:MAG: hypothetical protein LBS21_15210 [Clostridiales bacterium]|jgi:tetratricopeptide (TPR) repeat protein|nr:hypothetical protein [Clostridiales bacterium]
MEEETKKETKKEDIKKKPRKGNEDKMGAIIHSAIGGAAGAFIGVFAASSLPDAGPAQTLINLSVMLLLYFIAIFIQVIIHESGHLVCGLLSGYRFLSFRIFNLMFSKENGKLKLKKYALKGTMGQCLLLAPETSDNNFPYVLYNLGGALFNFISCVLSALLLLLLPGSQIATYVFVAFLSAGLMFGLTNIIPLRAGGMANDGYNIRLMNKSESERAGFKVMLSSAAFLASGSSFENMPEELRYVPENFNGPISVYPALFLLDYYMAMQDFKKAEELAEKILEEGTDILLIHKNGIRCELLFLEIIGECRKEKIEQLYTKELKKSISVSLGQPSILRLMYFYEKIVSKDNKKAEEMLKMFEKVCKTFPFPANAEAEKRLVEMGLAIPNN